MSSKHTMSMLLHAVRETLNTKDVDISYNILAKLGVVSNSSNLPPPRTN